MKNVIFAIVTCTVAFILCFGMNACKAKDSKTTDSETPPVVVATEENSRTSVDWEGTYTGVIPCADCEGIATTITLREDDTYTLEMEYLGKEGSAVTLEGLFQWNDAGSIVILNGVKKRSMPSTYKVGENKLIQLDMEGRAITGELAANYELDKKPSEDLVEEKENKEEKKEEH